MLYSPLLFSNVFFSLIFQGHFLLRPLMLFVLCVILAKFVELNCHMQQPVDVILYPSKSRSSSNEGYT